MDTVTILMAQTTVQALSARQSLEDLIMATVTHMDMITNTKNSRFTKKIQIEANFQRVDLLQQEIKV